MAWNVGNLNHHGHLALICPSCRVGYALVLEPRDSPVRVHLLLAHLWTVQFMRLSMEPVFFWIFFQFTNGFPKPEVLYIMGFWEPKIEKCEPLEFPKPDNIL